MPGSIGILNQVLNKVKRLAAAALPGTLDGEVADGSVLGHLFASSDVTNYDRTKHSLEAIAETIAASGGSRAELEVLNDTTSSGTYVTLLEVTGPGILYAVFAKATSNGYIRVTMDGLATELPIGSATFMITAGDWDVTSNAVLKKTSDTDMPVRGIDFKNGLLIEGKIEMYSSLLEVKVIYGVG